VKKQFKSNFFETFELRGKKLCKALPDMTLQVTTVVECFRTQMALKCFGLGSVSSMEQSERNVGPNKARKNSSTFWKF
jgi:hypothetical protein